MSGSDLAPFVAAALHDKILSDLKEENEKLRSQLRQCRAIEVTGPEGQPVYARTYLDKGRNGSDLWCVKLSESEQLMPCPLANLAGLEIRIGGVVRAALNDRYDFSCFLHDYAEQEDGRHWVNICFTGGDVWLCVAIQGWPNEFWDAATANLENGDEWQFLQHLANTNAGDESKQVVIKDVTISIKSAKGALESLPAFNNPDTLEEEKHNDAVTAYLGFIAERLRASGNNEQTAEFMRKCQKLMILLCNDGIYGPGGAFDESISRLIQAQEELEWPSDFEDEGEGG